MCVDNQDQELMAVEGNRKMTGELDMNNKMIKDLALPTNEHDAVTVKFCSDCYIDKAEEHRLMKYTGNEFDGKNKKIINLTSSTTGSNAANKSYVDSENLLRIRWIRKW